MEYKTSVFYAGGGSEYTFPFEYLQKSFVKVRYQKPDGAFKNLEFGKDYNVEENRVTLTTASDSADKVNIYRSTPTDRMVKYVDASILKAHDMNVNELQTLHIMEEQTDYLTAYALFKADNANRWDARQLRLTNVALPQEPTDAVNKAYVDEYGVKWDQNVAQMKKQLEDQDAKINKQMDDKDDAWAKQLKDQQTLFNQQLSDQDTSFNGRIAEHDTELLNKVDTNNQKYKEELKTYNDGVVKQIHDDAGASATLAKKWAVSTESPDGAVDSKSAKTWAEEAEAFEKKATTSANNAKASEDNAKASETASALSAKNAQSAEANAKKSESASATSATAAKSSEVNAKASEVAAAESARQAAAGQINADWNETNADSMAFIKNKPQEIQYAYALKESTSRPTTCNQNFTDGCIRHYLASTAMNEGKPPGDGNIIHCAWDNGKWNTQLAIEPPHSTNTMDHALLHIRGENGSTWGEWSTLCLAIDSQGKIAYQAKADEAGNEIQATYARLGDMLGYGVVKGCTPSLINNTIHIDSGIVVAKTGNKHKVSAKDFNIATADTIPRYDVIAVDIDGNISYIKGTAAYVQNPQAGEATYKMSSQPIVGKWMRFGSIYGGHLKPTADSNVAGNNGYFLVGSTIADTVKNLVNVFNSIPALSDKWTAYTVEDASDQFMVREKVAGGGNTPRDFMKETKEPVPIIQLSMTRSVQEVITSPTIPNTSIPLCTIRIEKNNTPVLSDSRGITPNISPNIANVRAYGAVGDGVFDDSFAIQKAFDTGKSVYFPAGTYRIDTMITRTRNNNLVIDASNAHILYTGADYAFKLGSCNYSVFKFSTITALNGGGIWLCGDNTWRASTYTDIWFKEIAVETNGVYVTSSDWVWMNENYLHYGTFTRGDNGFYYFHNSSNGTSRWIFDHVSVEGVQRGFNFKQGDYAKKNNKWFTGFEFNNGRYEENDNLITVDGKATNFLIVSNDPVNDNYLEYTKECTDWVFISGGVPLGKLTNGRYFKGGTYIITSKDTDLTDLNNLTTKGTYSVTSYVQANQMKNSPITDMPFYVIMQDATAADIDSASNALSQIIYDRENRRKYTRMYTKSSATWTKWKLAGDITRDVSSQIKPLISDITLNSVNGEYRNGVITIQCAVNVTKIVPSGTQIINIPTSKNMILGWMLDNKNKTSIPWISYENKNIQAQADLEMGNTYTIYITYVANDSY